MGFDFTYAAAMKLILAFLILMTPFATRAADWVSLFDGKTLTGWVNQGDSNWAVENGTITADSGKVSLLTTEKKYDNYELKLEFKAAIGTNSGIFLNTEPKVKDEAVDCYEVNIADATNGFPTGSIVKHVKIEGMGEKDEWRSYHLKVLNGRVTVILDGKKLFEYVANPVRPAGLIGLQKNKGRIAFRNIKIKVIEK